MSRVDNALLLRDTIQKIVNDKIGKTNPGASYATVTGFNPALGIITVRYPGDDVDIEIPAGSIYPSEVGQVVRIEGPTGSRVVADVKGENLTEVKARTAQETADGKNTVNYGETPPEGTDHKDGDIWFDEGNSNMPHVWKDGNWVSIEDLRVSAIAEAQEDLKRDLDYVIENGTGTKSFYKPTEPTAAESKEGDLWFDTSESGNNELHTYVNGSWVSAADARIAAIQQAQAELASDLEDVVANGIGTRTHYTPTQPAAADSKEGDLWFDTSTAGKNALHVFTGGAWVSAADARLAELKDAQAEMTGDITAAQQKADEAFQNAADADSKAVTAKSAADSAADAAASAAGIANGKGKVLVQSTAPGAADRNAQTLWIDTTGGANTPKRWVSGTTWSAVTDKAATDAASAAATAQTKANEAKSAADAAQTTATNAQTAASNAQSTATEALTSANSKNTVTRSTSNPTAPYTGRVDDIWWKMSTLSSGGRVIAQYRWSGTAWLTETIDNAVIANLDAAKITTGYLAAARIQANTLNADTVLINGSLGSIILRDGAITTPKIAVGAITAESGVVASLDAGKITVGTLDAARIAAASLTSDKILVGAGRNVIPWSQVLAGQTVSPHVNSDYYGTGTVAVSGADATRGVPAHLKHTRTTSDPGVDRYVLQFYPAPFTGGASNRFAVQRGTWTLQVSAYTDVANLDAKVALIWYKADLSYGASATSEPVRLGTQPKNLSVSIDLPDAAAYIMPYIRTNQPGETHWVNPELAPAVGSTLIEPGAITTEKIAVGAITAESGIIASLDAGKITVGTLDSARIAANSITADKVLIGTPGNLIPGLEPGSNRGFSSLAWDDTEKALVVQGAQTVYPDDPGVPFAPGEYIVEAQIKSSKPARTYIGLYGLGPSWNYRYGISNVTATTSWVNYSATLTIPEEDGAKARMRILTDYQGDGTATTWIRNPTIRRRVGSTLIEQGAITTEKLATGAITAESGVIGSLDASKITVGKLSGARLEADAINGMQIIGATIATSTGFPRVQLDTAGIAVYKSSTVRSFFADAKTGNLDLVGNLATATSGNERVVLDNALWNSIEVVDEDGNLAGSVAGSGISVGIGGQATLDLFHAGRSIASSGSYVDSGSIMGPRPTGQTRGAILSLSRTIRTDKSEFNWASLDVGKANGYYTARMGVTDADGSAFINTSGSVRVTSGSNFSVVSSRDVLIKSSRGVSLSPGGDHGQLKLTAVSDNGARYAQQSVSPSGVFSNIYNSTWRNEVTAYPEEWSTQFIKSDSNSFDNGLSMTPERFTVLSGGASLRINNVPTSATTWSIDFGRNLTPWGYIGSPSGVGADDFGIQSAAGKRLVLNAGTGSAKITLGTDGSITGLPIATGDGVAFPTVAANGGSQTVTIKFPSGKFNVAPSVSAMTSHGRVTPVVFNITKTGFSFRVWNFTSSTAPAVVGTWIAVAAS